MILGYGYDLYLTFNDWNSFIHVAALDAEIVLSWSLRKSRVMRVDREW